MSKQAIAGRRFDCFYRAPQTLCVATDPKHPLYDERINLPLDEAMVLNVMANGVTIPLIVRKDGEEVWVVDGRQRRAWALEANKRLAKQGSELIEVPCKVEKGDDADMFGLTISLNECRKADSVVVKAKKVARYLAMGRTEEDAAIRFGVSVSTIQNRLSFLELDLGVRGLVEKGALSATRALELAELPRHEQLERAKEIVREGAPEATDEEIVAGAVKRKRKARGKGAPSKLELTSLSNHPDASNEARILLKWAAGTLKREEAALGVPWLAQTMANGFALDDANRKTAKRPRRGKGAGA